MCIICAQRTPDNFLARLDLHASARLGASAGNPDGSVLQGLGAVSERTDAPNNTTTPLTLAVGQSAYGTISGSTDVDWYALQVVAGQTYEVRLLGVGYQYLDDPLVGLYDATGRFLKSNDDGFSSFSYTHETDSSLTFKATTSGTYFLAADKYSTETGDYLLSVTKSNLNGMVFTIDEIAWQLTNNGNAYFGSPEAAVFVVGDDGALTVDVTGLTEEGQYLADQALQAWAIVTGITFTYVISGAEITFDDSDSSAYAQSSTSGTEIVSSSVNIGTDWLAWFGTSLDSYSFETYLHEIGHALGLAHGGNYNGSATYGTDNFYLNDSLAWSIMSYMQAYNDEFDFGSTGDVNSYLDASFRYIFTPQIADIIAIQNLYGDHSSAFTGNTTYGYNGNTGVTAIDNAVASGASLTMTVYDDAGTDTLDFSGYSGAQEISLIAESLSSVVGGVSNFGIARDVLIENALGGSGNDVLFGNGTANTLNGGTGSDTLIGGSGDDIYIVDGTDVITEVADGGNDTVQSAFTHTLGTNLENLTLTGTAATNGKGNSQNNSLAGNAGANILNGGVGTDTLTGGAGNDIYVTYGNDTITEAVGAGTDTVQSSITFVLGYNLENLTLTGTAGISGTGNSLNNILIGNDAANTLNGGIGTDTLKGGAANDIYVTDGADTITEGANAGTDTVQSSATYTLGANLENLTLTGSTAIDGTGNSQNNSLIGNGMANILNGGRGMDRLTGGAGNDSFLFSSVTESGISATSSEVITDFVRGQDKINLSAIDAFTGSVLNDSFVWRGTSAFSDAANGEVRFQKVDNAGLTNDYTMVWIDNDADAGVEMAIRLTGLYDLAQTDFIL